jgi:uncharacterized membrane protein
MPDPDLHAKEPVSALLTGPYGHPLHPILVTIPIGAWVASVVFDLASHVSGPAATLAVGAQWLLAIGVVGALAAACVGFLDYLVIPPGTPAHTTALQHTVLNLVITVGFAGSFAWRLGSNPGATAWGPLILSLICLALLTVSGSLGGKLAYRFGVRVVAESHQADGFVPSQRRSSDTAARPFSSEGA